MNKPLYILLIAAALLCSCATDTDCRQSADICLNIALQGDSMRLGVDSITYERVTYTTLQGITISGVGRDSILYDNATVSQLRLPLRPDTTVTDYNFSYKGHSGILSIHHQNDPQFVSLACGCFVYHTLDTAFCSADCVDSVRVLNTQITTAADNHLRIYVHQ